MTRTLAAILIAAAFTAPAFAQETKTLLCKDYAKMDNTQKMATLAELQTMNSEMASGQTVSSEELATSLNTECAKDPDKLVQDAMKEIHKM
ncbi:MAG: HdeA/HdeB family chaperone [Amaricoccus sp.]